MSEQCCGSLTSFKLNQLLYWLRFCAAGADAAGLPLGPEGLLPQQGDATGAPAAAADISLLVGPDFSLRCVHPGKPHMLGAGSKAFAVLTHQLISNVYSTRALQGLTILCYAALPTSCCHAADGWEQWQHRFEAPPVAAYATSSGKVDLLAPSQQQQQRAAMQPALLPAGRGGSAGSSGSGSDAVVLVAQNGSLYGIPAAHLTFEASSGTGTAVVVAAGKQGEQCQIPVVDRLVRQQQPQGSSSPGSALALLHEQQQRLREGVEDSSDPGSQCQPADSGYCAAATLGVYAVEQQGSSTLLLLLPPALNESTVATQQEQPRSSGSWLMLLVATGFGASISAVALVVMRRKATVAAAAAVSQQQLAAAQSAAANGSSGAAAAGAGDLGTGGKGRRKGSNGSSSRKQPQQMSNRLKGLMHQAASEEAEAAQRAPPTAPAATQQQQQAGRGDDSAPSTAALEAGYMDPAVRRRQVKDGVTLVGRMQVHGLGVLPRL